MARAVPSKTTALPGGSPATWPKLSLLEALTAEQDARACAVLTLRWIGRHTGIERGLCSTVDPETGRLVGLSGIGVALASMEAFDLDLADRAHPLVVALAGSEPVYFPRSAHAFPQPFETPLESEAFYAVPLTRTVDYGEFGPGLLLLAHPGKGPLPDDVLWAAELLGLRLVALWYRRAQVDERRNRRERGWLSGIINAVADPILLTDADGRILIANSSAEALLTADDQTSEGRRRAVALNNMLFSASLFTTTSEGAEPTRRELLLVDPIEGQDLLFEVMRTPVKVRLGEAGLVSVFHDVTDLRHATEEIEENYRRLRAAEAQTRAERDRLDLILNSVIDPVLVTDPGGSIVLMNPPAERLFTVRRGGDGAERRVRANDAVFSSFVSNLHASQARHWRSELNLIHPETGDTVPMEAIAGKVLSKQGEETAVVTILHDLTETMEKARLYEQVKRHSEELRDRVQEATAELAAQNELLRRQALDLEAASAAKSQFLANVSHELRTPLNAIIGYTHLLLEGVSGALEPRQRDKLQRLDSNARHLLAVINDLLDLTRIEFGKMPLQVERVRLSELVDEVMAEVEPLIARSRLEVVHTIADRVPELRTDRQKLKQIVLNFLSNALKFTPQGSVSILADYDGGAGEISVAVSDSGIGIPEENQKTIFEAFGQSDGSYAKRHGGTGLGLSICLRLAHLLGGRITLKSRVGEGSTFTLLIPPRVGDS
jgi:PAS domain S-box-containing protein